MKSDVKVTGGTVVLFLLALAAIVPGIILSGYVMTILWGWFVTPAFGLAVPSIPIMLGLSLILSYITHQTIYTEDNREPNTMLWSALVHSLVRPLITLGVGYIIHIYV